MNFHIINDINAKIKDFKNFDTIFKHHNLLTYFNSSELIYHIAK